MMNCLCVCLWQMVLPRVLFLEDVFPGSIVEYKSLDETAPAPPPGARIVCFPLEPKPHSAHAVWIAHYWHDAASASRLALST